MTTVKDLLRGKVPAEVLVRVPRSFDQVGSIAIVEVPKGLSRYQAKLAKAILDVNPVIKTVVRKVGGHVGKFRVQKYRVLAGVKTTVTEHRESGVGLCVDIAKVYFSPRLGHDRLRVAGLVKPGERVLVVGSGVGPYPLVIARHSNAKQVVGVDANPAAHHLAVQNVQANKLDRRVVCVCGDAKRVVPLLGVFYRVLITAPQQSAGLLEVALGALKPRGVLHYYTFAEAGTFDAAVDALKDAVRRNGRKAAAVSVIRCGQQSPRVWRVCLDVKLRD